MFSLHVPALLLECNGSVRRIRCVGDINRAMVCRQASDTPAVEYPACGPGVFSIQTGDEKIDRSLERLSDPATISASAIGSGRVIGYPSPVAQSHAAMTDAAALLNHSMSQVRKKYSAIHHRTHP